MENSIKRNYTEKLQSYTEQLKGLKRKSRYLVIAQLLSFCLAIGFVVAFTTASVGSSLWIYLALIMFVLYVIARRMDVSNGIQIKEAQNICQVYRHELQALDNDFSCFEDGHVYINPHHEYTYDMDIFGPQSLFNRLCRCVTIGGSKRLAQKFSQCALDVSQTDGRGDVNNSHSLKQRREAILELAQDETWRTAVMACGQDQQIQTESVLKAIDEMKNLNLSSWSTTFFSFFLAWTGCIGFIVVVLLSLFTSMSSLVPIWWGIIQFACIYIFCLNSLKKISKVVGHLHSQLKMYIHLMKVMAMFVPKTSYNKQLINVFNDEAEGALNSFLALEKIVDSLDRRGNILGLILFDTVFMSDYFLLRRFIFWQQRYANNVSLWIDTVSEMDACVSLATFCYNHPEMHEPEIVDDNQLIFEAEGLVHPFLGEKAIPNDFTLIDNNFYIITGANMAGKSTFLRSLGINYILAMLGMPVFAQRFRVSVFSLFSSMRTNDDLAHGISYFNAELLRLRQLIDSCKKNSHTLIILDEILKGTNSLDKLNGSKMFLDAISILPVTGVIATHDLELSKMEDCHPERFHNYCFEIKLSTEITYTYRITQGVARNQNATYLLRKMISDI